MCLSRAVLHLRSLFFLLPFFISLIVVWFLGRFFLFHFFFRGYISKITHPQKALFFGFWLLSVCLSFLLLFVCLFVVGWLMWYWSCGGWQKWMDDYLVGFCEDGGREGRRDVDSFGRYVGSCSGGRKTRIHSEN